MAAGIDPFAFAIFGILAIEAGLLTPPFGLIVFVVKGTVPDPDVTLADIFSGSIPLLVVDAGDHGPGLCVSRAGELAYQVRIGGNGHRHHNKMKRHGGRVSL